jgi:hypothetical protein
MNRISKASLLFIVLAIPVYGWAVGPCMPIAEACMQQGSYSSQREMVMNCVLPVVQGKKVLPNTNFTSSQMQKCLAVIAQRMEAHGQ